MYQGRDGDRFGQGKWTNYDHGIPCQNKSCKSYGRPHPNCHCTGAMLGMTPEWFAPKGTAAYDRAHAAKQAPAVAQAQKNAVSRAAGPKQEGISGIGRASSPTSTPSQEVMDQFKAGMNAKRMMADGGVVDFCSMTRKHDPSCEYYAGGGEVEGSDDPMQTVGHAAIHHGILGLLSNIGRSGMQDPEKHTHILEDAKNQHSERMNPRGESFKKTMGHHLGNHMADKNHEKAADQIQGHPLVGSVGRSHLTEILKRLGQPLLNQPSNPSAFRGAVDYLHSAVKGNGRLDQFMDSIIGSQGGEIHSDPKAREALQKKVEELRDEPHRIFEVGGDLGHYLPEHHAALSAAVATTTDYLKSLEPVRKQGAPLDDPASADPLAEARYHRALDIAHQPIAALQRVKEGTLIPQDMDALKTMYPKLYQVMAQKMFDRIVTSKSKDETIPYKQRQAMSLFLDQPLDSTLTLQSMQAIIRSAGAQQAQKQSSSQKRPSQPELNQINKTDELYALPTERREIDKKS